MRIIVCVVLLGLLLALPAAAGPGGWGQGGRPNLPGFWGDEDYKPVVGSWAEYDVTGGDEDPVRMRFAIVGSEGEHYWYEMAMTGADGDRVITKMLISGNPMQADRPKRLIVKSGDEPAMEMPIEMAAGMEGEMPPGAMHGEMEEMEKPKKPEKLPQDDMVDMGVESVTVPAGTFEAQRLHYESEEMTGDMWVKEGVGPFGLIKAEDPETLLILQAYGDEATSLITEEPKKFEIPSFEMPDMGGEG